MLNHVAIIMDGNRRWAKAKGLPPTDGHLFAAENAIEPLIEECQKQNIPYVTFWAFSTENWKRDKEELDALFSIFRSAFTGLALRFAKRGAKLRILGDVSRFPQDIARQCLEFINKTKDNNAITVSFALNYGGRDEILRAVKKIVSDGLSPDQITEENLASRLDTAGIPDPDLIIRTGGDKRLSGYLPWQAVYSELYFTDTLFPDFNVEQFKLALADYAKRDRRFGGNSNKK